MLFFSFFSLDSATVIVYLHHNNQQMATVKKYPTYVAHNKYCYALASVISLSQNEVKYNISDLPVPLYDKLFGVIGWIELTAAELHQINDVRQGVYRVGDTMMKNLLNSK